MRNFDIIHKVSRGETLSQISLQYNVPVSLIISCNFLKDEIYAGQRLIIPAVTGEIYRVKPSDNIEGIAAKFGVSAQKILDDNNIEIVFPFMEILIKN